MLFELTLTILKLLVQLKMYNNLNCHLFKLFVNYLNFCEYFLLIYYFYAVNGNRQVTLLKNSI